MYNVSYLSENNQNPLNCSVMTLCFISFHDYDDRVKSSQV